MSEIEIPKGWKLKKLNEICSKITDGAHKTPTYVNDGAPFLRVTDIHDKIIDWKSVKRIPLSEHLELIKRCKPEFGDVLYSKNGTIGISKVVDWKDEFSTFVSLALLKPKKEIINSYFLKLFLDSSIAIKQATKRSKNATVTNLHLEEIREIEIPIPSIETQKKIVQKLDDVLGQLEEKKKGVSELQSIKLKNLKYLSDNFMSYIISKFIPIESYPAYWKSVTLSDIFLIINQKWQPNSKSANLNYIGLENIESNTGKLVNFLPTNSLKIKSSKTHFLKKHVLYGKLRPYLNKILLPTFDGVCSTDILVLEPKSIVLREFLAYFLRSSHVLSKMTQLMYGTKMPRVKIQDLEKLRLGLPSKEEQEKIIRKIQRSENHIHTIKESITTSIEQQEKTLEYLKYLQSSILDKAFSGKLVN